MNSTTTSSWRPVFPDQKEEKRIEIDEEILFPFSDSQIGIIVTENIPSDSAACFVCPEEIYLRMNWQIWFRVSTDNATFVKDFGKKHTVILRYETKNMMKKDYSIPVYHVERLPPLFEGISVDKNENFCSKIQELAMQYHYKVVKCFNHHGTDFSLVNTNNNYYLLVSTFDNPGDWVADEEKFNDNDEAPLWFSVTNHTVSPLTQNMRLRKRLEECIGRKMDSLIVFSDKTNLLNASEMKQIWANIDIMLCMATGDHFKNGLALLEPVIKEWTENQKDKSPEDNVDELLCDYIDSMEPEGSG